MKPKNKFQREIAALSKRLPKISVAQRQWAYTHCFEHIARKTKKGAISCLDCGKEWTDKTLAADKTVCPHCGAKLTVKETRAYKFKQVEYFCIVTKCKDFQVLRFFYIQNYAKKGEPANCYCTEVVQRWIAPDGKYATMAMLRPMFCFSDSWQWSSNLEIRPDKDLYDIMPTEVYPRMSLIPELKRNGFTRDFCNLTPFELFHAILTDNHCETLLKTGQKGLLKHLIRNSLRNADTYWNSVRIANRNGYIVKDASMWCDYIDLLHYMGKDTNSPKYVCPSDLKTEHDLFVQKKTERREREQIAQQKQKALENEQRFKELKGKFFGIAFTDGTIQVRVLESVLEFLEEGTSMHHCLYSNAYYLKSDSLILSACIDGKRIETIEVSLKTMKVVQSRGVCNTNTEYHDRIIALVNKNKRLIRKRMAA